MILFWYYKDLAEEKLSNEKLKQEKTDLEKKVEESRLKLASFKEEMVQVTETASDSVRTHKQMVTSIRNKALILAQKLKERDRLIQAIR